MSSSSEKQPMQAFRSKSIDKVIHVPAKMDSKAGHHIVLWKDIQRVFKGADFIMHEASMVSFMTDENFEEYVQELGLQVLEVIVSDNSPVPKITGVNAAEDEPTDQGNSYWSQPSIEDTTGIASVTPNVVNLSIADINTDSQTLVMYSEDPPEDSRSSLRVNHQQYSSYLEIIMSGQELQATNIKQSMDQHFDRLQTEMERNKALQEQLVQMQQQMDAKQQQMQQMQLQMDIKQQQMYQMQLENNGELLRRQEEMLQMQQQALDRLSIIQSRVQSVLTQNYELHEYPIPRLFIVLPVAVGLAGKFKSIFSDQFRLYFLCECGSHTMTENTKTPHEIHLAKHEGYDLEMPTEFFERYGSYVLTLMHMIKYGVTAAGLMVPPLASSKIVEGIDTAQRHLDELRKNIVPLVDDTINFLNGMKRNNGTGEDLTDDHSYHAEFDQLEALEGADLRQLESYLKVKDQGRVLGNLYRIVTLEGHVKWVCFDHYRASYRESAIQQLREIVSIHEGTFIEETGKIEIRIDSNIQAKQFYDAMIKTRGIQELEITLDWDATMEELRAFSIAVTKANVIRLTVNGIRFKSPALDVVNRSQRFDPILRLASNSRIQMLQLNGFEDFFSRISKSAMAPAPKLRVFSVDSGLSLKDKVIKSFNNFLGHCSSLTTLEVRLHPQHSIAKAISDILGRIRDLNSLKIDCGKLCATASVVDGKIQDITLTIEWLYDLTSEDLEFIQQGHFTRLTVKYGHQWAGGDRLADTLRDSPFLSYLQVGSQEHSLAIATTFDLPVQDLMRMATSALETPNKLESFSIDCRRFSLSASCSQGKAHDIAIVVPHLADLSSDDISFIKQNRITRLSIESSPLKTDESRFIDMIRHIPELKHLQIECNGERRRTTANRPELRLQDLVKIVVSENSGRLESFSFGNGKHSLDIGFSQGRVHDMMMNIEKLGDLSPDDLTFIQQGHLTRLVICHTPSKADEGRLVNIIGQCPELIHLQIDCKEELHRTLTTYPSMKPQELVMMATSDTLPKLESLRINWGENSVTTRIPCDRIQEVDLTIERIGDLASGDFMFIQKEHLARLAILYTPAKSDEGRLSDVLRRSTRLGHLQIGCKPDRWLSIINFVISARERILQETGSCRLHTFELMEERLVPFDIFGGLDINSHMQSHLSFAENSTTFEMKTWIRLRIFDGSYVNDFIRQYGWSIVFLDGNNAFNTTFGLIEDSVSSTRASQLEHLHAMIGDAGAGEARLDKIIQQLPNITGLGLSVVLGLLDTFFEQTQRRLTAYRNVLTMVQLSGVSFTQWLPQIALTFPTRDCFPSLMSFGMSPTLVTSLPSICVPWIVAMVSSPPRGAVSLANPSSSQQNISDEKGTPQESVTRGPWTPLRKIVLSRIKLQPEEWRLVIEAMDFSELEHLRFGHSNLSREQFRLLIDRIPDRKIFKAPFKFISVRGTNLVKGAESRSVLDELRKKTPWVNIVEE
ncbi:hypothetical protein BGX34_011714 [Mortierella sp. NVP85]|nr:hypothetical protein BGX34_011714 [Mortierella sp. NVP85]